ncbi:MAG: serine hydrolase [Rhodospirillales bacterium]|nr:serine hydrolase [Rhodospirillales bacterium]
MRRDGGACRERRAADGRQARGCRSVVGAARAHRGGDAEACRLRPGAGRRHAGGALRQDRVDVDARQARRGGGRCDEARRDLPHLLHDQADRQRRGHADGRGRQAADQRPRIEVPARDRQDEGRHREGRRRPAGPAAQRSRAAHDGAGSAASHVGLDLRHARRGPGQPVLCRGQDRRSRHEQRGVRRQALDPGAEILAGRALGIRRVDRRARPAGRGRRRQEARRGAGRTRLQAAGHGRYRLPGAGRQAVAGGAARTATQRPADDAALRRERRRPVRIRRRRAHLDDGRLPALRHHAGQWRIARRQARARQADAGLHDGGPHRQPARPAAGPGLWSRLRGAHHGGRSGLAGFGRRIWLGRQCRHAVLGRPQGTARRHLHGAGERSRPDRAAQPIQDDGPVRHYRLKRGERHEPSGSQSRESRPAVGGRRDARGAACRDAGARYESGGGGLLGTTEDYLRFTLALANGGAWQGKRIIGRKTLEFMTADHVGNRPGRPDGFGFGLGVEVHTKVGESAFMGSVGEYGWSGAAGMEFWIDPKEELVGLYRADRLKRDSLQFSRGGHVISARGWRVGMVRPATFD